VLARLGAWTAWWLALFWLWLLLTGDWNRIELIGAACGAALAATIAELLRAAARGCRSPHGVRYGAHSARRSASSAPPTAASSATTYCGSLQARG
jgi:hypothetical protein